MKKFNNKPSLFLFYRYHYSDRVFAQYAKAVFENSQELAKIA